MSASAERHLAIAIFLRIDFVNFDVPKEKRQDEGKGLVVFNSGGFLEIAMFKSDSKKHGSAATLMGLGLDSDRRVGGSYRPVVPKVGTNIP
mgnify:CR=1 FL=1